MTSHVGKEAILHADKCEEMTKYSGNSVQVDKQTQRAPNLQKVSQVSICPGKLDDLCYCSNLVETLNESHTTMATIADMLYDVLIARSGGIQHTLCLQGS